MECASTLNGEHGVAGGGGGGEGEDSLMETIAAINFKMPPCFPSAVLENPKFRGVHTHARTHAHMHTCTHALVHASYF